MAELAIHIFGDRVDRHSLHRSAGPITARVEVDGGTDAYLIDEGRGHVRIAAAPEGSRWMSPRGLLMIARDGRWGCRTFEDHLPRPGRPADFPRTTRENATMSHATKNPARAALARGLIRIAKAYQGLTADLRMELAKADAEGIGWADQLILEARRVGSNIEEAAVDVDRGRRELATPDEPEMPLFDRTATADLRKPEIANGHAPTPPRSRKVVLATDPPGSPLISDPTGFLEACAEARGGDVITPEEIDHRKRKTKPADPAQVAEAPTADPAWDVFHKQPAGRTPVWVCRVWAPTKGEAWQEAVNAFKQAFYADEFEVHPAAPEYDQVVRRVGGERDVRTDWGAVRMATAEPIERTTPTALDPEPHQVAEATVIVPEAHPTREKPKKEKPRFEVFRKRFPGTWVGRIEAWDKQRAQTIAEAAFLPRFEDGVEVHKYHDHHDSLVAESGGMKPEMIGGHLVMVCRYIKAPGAEPTRVPETAIVPEPGRGDDWRACPIDGMMLSDDATEALEFAGFVEAGAVAEAIDSGELTATTYGIDCDELAEITRAVEALRSGAMPPPAIGPEADGWRSLGVGDLELDGMTLASLRDFRDVGDVADWLEFTEDDREGDGPDPIAREKRDQIRAAIGRVRAPRTAPTPPEGPADAQVVHYFGELTRDDGVPEEAPPIAEDQTVGQVARWPSWTVWDVHADVELGIVESRSHDGARRKARRTFPTPRTLLVTPRPVPAK